MLGPLQNNGGPVFTHALLPGSPATIRARTSSANATDQRGFTHLDDPTIANAAGGDGTDIGAYEAFELRITALTNWATTCNSASPAWPAQITDYKTEAIWSLDVEFGAAAFQVMQRRPKHGDQSLRSTAQFYRIHQLP